MWILESTSMGSLSAEKKCVMQEIQIVLYITSMFAFSMILCLQQPIIKSVRASLIAITRFEEF